jgi:hypothetical protein
MCARVSDHVLYRYMHVLATHRIIQSDEKRVCVHVCVCVCRVGQNHIYTVYIRYFWLGNHQIYSAYIRIYTVLANPMCVWLCMHHAYIAQPDHKRVCAHVCVATYARCIQSTV